VVVNEVLIESNLKVFSELVLIAESRLSNNQLLLEITQINPRVEFILEVSYNVVSLELE
jgi:hypothetical protein